MWQAGQFYGNWYEAVQPVSTSSVYQCVGQLCDLGLGEVLCHAAHASWIFGVLLRLPEAVWSFRLTTFVGGTVCFPPLRSKADRQLSTKPGHSGRGNSCPLWGADSKRLNDRDGREAANKIADFAMSVVRHLQS
jgi:hypothetical protein